MEDGRRTGTRYTNYPNPDEIGIVHEAKRREEFDAVFVGTGIGGMMGAMICAEQMPDARILLLDKDSRCGGLTRFAERNAPKPGMAWKDAVREGHRIAAESKYIKDARLYAERAYDYGKNSAWMYLKHHFKLRHSAGFTPAYEGGNGVKPIMQLKAEIDAGGVYQNLEIRLNTRATALLLEDEYTCKGIQVRSLDGEYTDIYAKAVVLATGGMSNNFELLQYYTGQDIIGKCEAWPKGQDGDGHLMAEQTAHGKCKSICLSSLLNHVKGFSLGSTVSVAVCQNPTCLFVNQEGLRFVDEGSLKDVTFCKAVEQQGKVFSIMGSALRERYESGGLKRMQSIGEPRNHEKIDMSEELERQKDNENVFRADTLKELAERMGVPAKALAETVKQYDEDCIAGSGDSVFGKSADNMYLIGEGPYYAFRVYSGILNTNNGIRINHNAQVVDPFYTPVKGLYAAGICASGFNGEVYSVATCQSSSTWAGSKAARHLIEHCCGGKVSDDWFGDKEYTTDCVISYENDEVISE